MIKVNLIVKKSIYLLASLMLFSVAVYSESVMNSKIEESFRNELESFSTDFLRSAPSAAMQQNVWDDAFIGTLIPGIKFGFGSTTGVSSLDVSGLKTAFETLENASSGVTKMASYIPNYGVLPVTTIDVRLGGIILPFDIGFSVGMLKPKMSGFDFNTPSSIYNISDSINFDFGNVNIGINYLAIGVDARYCLYEGIFDFSVGAGYYHLSQTLGLGMNYSGKSGFMDGVADFNTTANFGMSLKTDVITAQAQISKNFVVTTIFGGARLSVSKTTTSWGLDIEGNGTVEGNPIPDTIKEYIGDTYSSGNNWFKNFQPSIYAGASLNLLAFKFTVNVGTDLGSLIPAIKYQSMAKFNWTGGLALHVKL